MGATLTRRSKHLIRLTFSTRISVVEHWSDLNPERRETRRNQEAEHLLEDSLLSTHRGDKTGQETLVPAAKTVRGLPLLTRLTTPLLPPVITVAIARRLPDVFSCAGLTFRERVSAGQICG